ncbi:hypothetical protein [Ktedonosporobacter rubrisoli]|nr:hypothetical protein [Ktedonosporobacter rubrisoli]
MSNVRPGILQLYDGLHRFVEDARLAFLLPIFSDHGTSIREKEDIL